ncbi:hypothetical protein B0F90DRAFT_191936 [Multifurca ochricompacta]|uniref:Uncharacterized protein n=1 Tax=Multifurca ochricompacta TaxID=376703 RepID=A0AAD4LY51_9AGAM|nr:hypothetical protein B0F90DRAFT_191936 [Multifurca ochricompacta]
MQLMRLIKFLELTENYANEYLLIISTEIQRRSSFLEMLKMSFNMAEGLRAQLVDLRKQYETGIVAPVKDARRKDKIALSQPLPEDFDLFTEVDLMLSGITQCYIEMDNFWIKEIRRASKALKTRRSDQIDAENWQSFQAALQRTVESWKVFTFFSFQPGAHSKLIRYFKGNTYARSADATPPCSSSHSLSAQLFDSPVHLRHYINSLKGAEFGTVISFLSSAMRRLQETLKRVRASASVGSSHPAILHVLKAEIKLASNREACFEFFRLCIRYGKIIDASHASLKTHPALSHPKSFRDLQERAIQLQSETTRARVSNVEHLAGSSSCKYYLSLKLSTQQALVNATLRMRKSRHHNIRSLRLGRCSRRFYHGLLP